MDPDDRRDADAGNSRGFGAAGHRNTSGVKEREMA
jgi:hypothetical protein